jgi:hypothetical protein
MLLTASIGPAPAFTLAVPSLEQPVASEQIAPYIIQPVSIFLSQDSKDWEVRADGNSRRLQTPTRPLHYLLQPRADPVRGQRNGKKGSIATMRSSKALACIMQPLDPHVAQSAAFA